MNIVGPEDAAAAGFEDALLYAYIDGDADPDTAAAIAASPEASARADRLRRELLRLQSAFHRIDCPETDDLLDHVVGWLLGERATEVAAHIEDCRICAEEVAEIASFQGPVDDLHEESIADRIRSIVATLVSGPGFNFGAAPVALRGDGDPWIFEADDAMIALVAGKDQELPDRREISGQVTGVDAVGWMVEVRASAAEGTDQDQGPEPDADASASTAVGGEPVATGVVDDVSTFAIGGLAPGEYSLILRDDKRRIVVSKIPL